MPTDIEVPFATALDMFNSLAASSGERQLVHYSDELTFAEVDRASDALAAPLADLAQVATWTAIAAAVWSSM